MFLSYYRKDLIDKHIKIESEWDKRPECRQIILYYKKYTIVPYWGFTNYVAGITISYYFIVNDQVHGLLIAVIIKLG